MKKGKASDDHGVKAELLKVESLTLRSRMLEAFNAILAPGEQLPDGWLAARIAVLHQKGGASLPGNYRPIAILAILYKLFGRLLCGRLRGAIIGEQSIDRAACRKGFSS
eukprot:1336860-Pyramimonas_sp.AAC.1